MALSIQQGRERLISVPYSSYVVCTFWYHRLARLGTSDSVERNAMADEIKRPDKDEQVKRTDLSSERPSRRLGPPYGKEPPEFTLEPAQEIILRAAPPAIILRGRPAELFASVVCTAAWFGLVRYGAGLNGPLALTVAVGATLFFGVMGTGGRLRLSFGMRWRGRGRREGGED
jgi:hypothetical protein